MNVWVVTTAYDGESVTVFASKERAAKFIREYVEECRDWQYDETRTALDALVFDVDVLVDAYNTDHENSGHGEHIGLEELPVHGFGDPECAICHAPKYGLMPVHWHSEPDAPGAEPLDELPRTCASCGSFDMPARWAEGYGPDDDNRVPAQFDARGYCLPCASAIPGGRI